MSHVFLTRKNVLFATAMSVALLVTGPYQTVKADTLNQALATAYSNNPTLRAERARQRSTDENVPQALAGWRPNIAISADAGYDKTTTRPGFNGGSINPRGSSISVIQPLFQGFRTVNSTRQAEADVNAGLQTLLSVEQNILLQSVTAYMDVMRDKAIVKLQRQNLQVLVEQLKASEARFRVGEVTRTDVAQSQASRAGAVSTLAQARANLSSSRAVYGRVIGRAAGSLKYPGSIRRKLPRTLNSALAIGKARNPGLLTASYNERSARHQVNVIRGELMPSLSLEASYSYRKEPSSTLRTSENASLFAQLSVPLYQSGSVYSRVRQAKHSASQRRLLVLEAERTVVSNVISSWEGLQASRAQIRSDRAQVKANTLALEGVKQEALVGSRTTLDVLDAEQALLNSNVNEVQSQRNEVVASYQLLASIGKLTAFDLKLRVRSYDPAANFNKVRNKLFGTNIGESDITR